MGLEDGGYTQYTGGRYGESGVREGKVEVVSSKGHPLGLVVLMYSTMFVLLLFLGASWVSFFFSFSLSLYPFVSFERGVEGAFFSEVYAACLQLEGRFSFLGFRWIVMEQGKLLMMAVACVVHMRAGNRKWNG